MKALVIAAALAVALVLPAQAGDHVEVEPPIYVEDRICDNGNKFGFCDFIVTSTVIFVLIDWLAPLNRADADPYRCRGEGSVLKVPSPWGDSNCKPLR